MLAKNASKNVSLSNESRSGSLVPFVSIDVEYFVFQEAAKSYLYDSLWSVSLYKALGDPTRNRKSDLPRILRWGELTIRMRKEQFGRAGDEDETGQTRFFFNVYFIIV